MKRLLPVLMVFGVSLFNAGCQTTPAFNEILVSNNDWLGKIDKETHIKFPRVSTINTTPSDKDYLLNWNQIKTDLDGLWFASGISSSYRYWEAEVLIKDDKFWGQFRCRRHNQYDSGSTKWDFAPVSGMMGPDGQWEFDINKYRADVPWLGWYTASGHFPIVKIVPGGRCKYVDLYFVKATVYKTLQSINDPQEAERILVTWTKQYLEEQKRKTEFALPECLGSPKTGYLSTVRSWNNCEGTLTYPFGGKYVGEWKDGNKHGQGTLTHTDLRVEEGIWKNSKFLYAQKVSPTVTAKKSPEPSSDVQKKLEKLEKLQKEEANEEAQRVAEAKRRAEEERKAKEEAQRVAEVERKKKEEQQRIRKLAKEKAKELAKLKEQALAKQEEDAKKRQTQNKEKTPKPKPVQKVPKRPDDVAVIIANSNYKKLGKDIPNVDPAYNDAKNIKKYFMESLGVREGNIIYLKDATGAQLMGVFGNKDNHKARLFNWVKPNKSNVYVYYAGHGAPASKDGSAFLVPSDANSQTIEFSGYPLTNLYRNLGKIKARSVTVILEACFSGFSQAGALLPRSSGITITPKEPTVPSNVKVISAGAADQMASWEKDESQSLFTKYFLLAMSGEGDKKPYGNGDGKVEDKELQNYLDDTMTYFARRYYGRDQRVQIVKVR